MQIFKGAPNQSDERRAKARLAEAEIKAHACRGEGRGQEKAGLVLCAKRSEGK